MKNKISLYNTTDCCESIGIQDNRLKGAIVDVVVKDEVVHFYDIYHREVDERELNGLRLKVIR